MKLQFYGTYDQVYDPKHDDWNLVKLPNSTNLLNKLIHPVHVARIDLTTGGSLHLKNNSTKVLNLHKNRLNVDCIS